MSVAGRIVLGIAVLLAAAAGIVWTGAVRRGFSARDTPSALEADLAGRMRHWAVPAGARRARSPLAAAPEVVAEARAHFADHCASCHGNDGRGQTEIGRNLYPKAPDMQARGTQSLSDGELFWIIKNGVRLTGMPAWGSDTLEDDRESWKLVAFIRHLPRITAAELEEMNAMNPVSPAELKEAREEEEFLEGGGQEAQPPEKRKQGMKH
jgi:mono/diheme cytochrome c family protein